MVEWVDVVTWRTYRFSETGLQKVRRHVARLLAQTLEGKSSVRAMADAAADFWTRQYYELVFPLGFGRALKGGAVSSVILPCGAAVPVGEEVEFRSTPLEDAALPPILPAGQEGGSHSLLADVTLVRAALINVGLRQRGTPTSLLNALRLACLTAPLGEELAEELREHGTILPPEVERLVAFLRGGEPVDGFDAGLLRTLWDAVESTGVAEALPNSLSVVLVIGAVQRVKQYVFETPGLNEIRGGSELLERVTKRLREEVAGELGAEVVLRAAGAHIEFLAPEERTADGSEWAARIRQAFGQATGGALVAAVAHRLPVRDLLIDFPTAVGRAYQELELARNEAGVQVETLPFEKRCSICRRRAAEGWFVSPEGLAEPACRVCITKREYGQKARHGKTEELAKLLGAGSDPWGLGGALKLPDSLNELVPGSPRRRWVAVVYGDGNNFGAVVQQRRSIAEALRWTQRVSCVTRSAAALALAEAVQASARYRKEQEGEGGPGEQKLPFQVLALGGEDLSLFAWAPVGLRFAQRFVELTDREFEPAGGTARERRVCFSLGVLVTDEKAPVRRTVHFTEEELLKWAKRAARNAGYRHGGTIAFLIVPSADQIPGDLEEYKQQTYLRQGKTFPMCLTLRPLTAAEVGFLLEKAARLRERGHTGHVERIAAAFARGQPQVAILYYIYQKVREQKAPGQPSFTEVLEEAAGAPATLEGLEYPAALLPGRLPFGEGTAVPEPGICFSPLGDLAELVKVL